MQQGPYMLGAEVDFPSPDRAHESGLLAIGGEVTPEWLLAAYRRGIFPWPWIEDSPMLWWSPDPRFVLYPDELRVSKSLRQRLGSCRFDVRLDTDFAGVMRGCAAAKRADDPGTWITDEMLAGYVALLELGWAHSVESWRDGELVGGLYGVALGGVFFGESMFFRESDASKVAFATLVKQLGAWGFAMIDCQLHTGHLESLGACEVSRAQFLEELVVGLALPNRRGPWRLEES